MELLLRNVTWQDGTQRKTGDVRIRKSVITEVGDLHPKNKEQDIDFAGHFIYPGMINSHDHLEMNLYPKLGTPPYNNYVSWSKDIYKPDQSPIVEIQKVNIKDRLLWGGLKNLISGVTTVVHHNPWHRSLGSSDFPVRVLKQMTWAHSLVLGGNVKKLFPKNKKLPFVIHAAEGVDELAFSELSKLDSLGLLQENTVLIHGVAIDQDQMEILSRNKTSLVWCPASNLFMFGKTAPIDKLKNRIRVTLGSDSTLTGSPTLLDEMRVSEQTQLASQKEIMEMVTSNAASIFNLPVPAIAIGSPADIFITPIIKNDYTENLLSTTPSDIAFVIVNDEVRLQNDSIDNKKWKSVKNEMRIKGQLKKTNVDVASLKKKIESVVGNKILEKNPLWTLIEV